MDPELETLETSFNNRIEQWISKQGLLYQFTHDTGSGSMFPKICGLFFRLLILCLIGLVIFWFYLTSRPGSESFRVDVEKQIMKGLNAGEVKISNISRAKGGLLTGEMLFSNISMGESPNSFFEDWYTKEEDVSVVGRRTVIDKKKIAHFRGVNLSPLGLGDNYFSGWSGQEMKILGMELKLKTGGDTDAEAMATYSTLFRDYESLKIGSIQVFDATVLWGHSETSAGSIKDAQLDIVKVSDSWVITVTGGKFSHSWLQGADIRKMKVICKKSGEVVIESASFNLGEGVMNLSASIQVKAQPEVTGMYSFENVDIEDLIGDNYERWLDGNIDGKGELSGFLNTAKGIKITTTVKLVGSPKKKEAENDGKDCMLIIRGDNFSLLKLMQMKNPRNSYSLLRAYRGKLTIVNQGKDTNVRVEDVRCGQHDLILMRGEFDYAVRTLRSEKESSDTSSLQINRNEGESDDSINISVADEVETVRAFSGRIKLGFIPEVFENNIKVLDTYPVDNATLRVWFDLNLDGELEELTEGLADELYDIMKSDENNE